MTFKQRLATLVSFIFNPLTMPVIGLFIILHANTTEALLPAVLKKYLYLLVFSGTFLLPLCLVPFYWYQKKTPGPFMHDPSDRRLPLLLTFIFYSFTVYYLYKLPFHYLVETLAFCIACSVSVMFNFIIILKWKISSHLIGTGGIMGLIFIEQMLGMDVPVFYFIVTILTTGVVAWSRMFLKEHNILEVAAGFFLGFFVVAGIILLFNQIPLL